MKTRTIQKHLKQCSKEELIQLIIELAKENPNIERHLNAKFNIPTAKRNFDQYKAYVRSEFFPERGYGDGNPSAAYRMIERVESEATNYQQIIDFIYFCVETVVEYTLAYGDIDEEFYNAFVDLFEQATKLAFDHGLIKQYSTQAHKIVTNTSGIGWGFHDDLIDIFK